MSIGQLRAAVRRLIGVVCRRRMDREFSDELESHLALHTDDNIRAGMTPEEARRQAILALGGIEPAKERHRDRRGVPALDVLAQDVRLALRSLHRSPGFTIAVVLMLGAGIALTTLAFGIANAVLFRPSPGIEDQQSLVRISLVHDVEFGRQFYPVAETTASDFEALERGVTHLAGLVADLRSVSVAGSVGGEARIMSAALVSGNYFDVLGVRMPIGRGFLPEEDDEPWRQPAVVVSHAFWQRHFDGDPAVPTGEVLVNGAAMRIVGVAPAHFSGAWGGVPDLWLPFSMAEIALRDDEGRPVAVGAAGLRSFRYVGRLRAGSSIEQVRAQVVAVAGAIAAADPGRSGMRANVAPVGRGLLAAAWGPGDPLLGTLTMLMLPAVLLAMACISSGNLLFARATQRAREWTLRLALGSSTWRLARCVLVESVLLAAAAVAVGLLLAQAGVWLGWFLPPGVSDADLRVVLDHRVLLFACGAAGLAVLAFGLGPALSAAARASAAGPAATRVGRHARSRLKLALVAVQVAFSLALLATGWQFINTVRAAGPPIGIADPDRVLVVSFDLAPLQLPDVQVDEFYRRLFDRVGRQPGIAALALADGGSRIVDGLRGSSRQVLRLWLPADASTSDYFGGSAGEKRVPAIHVAGDLPGVLGQPIEGRWFESESSGVVRTVVVTREFAERHFAGAAIGRTLTLAPQDDGVPAYEVTIVGVTDTAGLFLFHPSPVASVPGRTLFGRLRTGTPLTASALHEIVREIDPRVPIADVATVKALSERRWSDYLSLIRILTGFGVLALALAAAGLFSVLSFIVRMRAHEIGVRAVLGARPSLVLRLILRQATVAVTLGLIAGGAAAAATGTLVRSELYGASPVDPIAMAGAGAVLLAVMAAACAVPAYRAVRVDPGIALRDE